HGKPLSLGVDYFWWLASCFGSSCLDGPFCCNCYTYQYKHRLYQLLAFGFVVAIVGVAVVVVAAGAVVESSSVIKLSFV
ncbi:hypothetical protein Tco_0069474, partial [Tanacetum coccineum]